MTTSAANFSDVFQDGCNLEGYSELLENLKYLFQVFYFVPAIVIHIRILAILLFRHRKVYMIQSFFIIFSIDSIASLTQIVIDLFVQRVTIYVPQVCPVLYEALLEYRMIPYCYFIIYNYMRAAKSVIQSCLTLNRMTCVLMPLSYGRVSIMNI
uniref:Serpentine receptor class gamma n=1 Tax=Caenorhabditis japonica TaxID=281687 RepID=A0A8R1HVF3_CAEJA